MYRFPSVGKSTLLTNLAGVYSEVAEYEFTTLTTVPGVVRYKGAKIQLLDLPGIIEGAKDGKGRGRQVIAVARTCDLILIVLDVLKPLGHKRIIERELEGFGIRLNKTPPNIYFKKKDKGGLNLTSTELDIIYKIPHCVPLSAHHKWNFDDLLEKIWCYLNLIRIYTKPKGQLPDYSAPIVVHAEAHLIEDLCAKIHKNLLKELK
uniref:OBG-type G domain-containing protein n=1 Tax=Romanomermis culicivorax TaxID=13658 RepID=A0A915IYF7_ROMCU